MGCGELGCCAGRLDRLSDLRSLLPISSYLLLRTGVRYVYRSFFNVAAFANLSPASRVLFRNHRGATTSETSNNIARHEPDVLAKTPRTGRVTLLTSYSMTVDSRGLSSEHTDNFKPTEIGAHLGLVCNHLAIGVLSSG